MGVCGWVGVGGCVGVWVCGCVGVGGCGWVGGWVGGCAGGCVGGWVCVRACVRGHEGGFSGSEIQKYGITTKRMDQLAPNLAHMCGFIWDWTQAKNK